MVYTFKLMSFLHREREILPILANLAILLQIDALIGVILLHKC